MAARSLEEYPVIMDEALGKGSPVTGVGIDDLV